PAVAPIVEGYPGTKPVSRSNDIRLNVTTPPTPTERDTAGVARRRAGRVWSAAAGVIVLALGCGKPAPVAQEAAGPIWFEDVTEAVGLHFTHDAGPADGR